MVSFSPEEIGHFQVRFEEGYDLPDERYQQWVRMYHPESIHVRESTNPRHGPVSPPESVHVRESTSPSCTSPESVHVCESTSPCCEPVSSPDTPERAKKTCSTLQRSSVLS